jgi:hypothetical protein
MGLGFALRRPLKSSAQRVISLPICAATGGTLPGINLDRNAELIDRMDHCASRNFCCTRFLGPSIPNTFKEQAGPMASVSHGPRQSVQRFVRGMKSTVVP